MEVPGILKKTTIRTKRTLMVYVSAFLFMFAYTVLAFSIATFMIKRFPDNPNAILFVGIILGVASFFAIFVDTVWSYLQKVIEPRKLTLWALAGIMMTVAIFFFADFKQLGELFSVFRWSTFTIIAAFLYGWSYDLYDVTITTTIVKRSDKAKLAQNISQKKVAEAFGMVSGLLLAGLLSLFGAVFTQAVLLIILFFVFIFFKLHYDIEEDEEEKLEFSEHALTDWKAVFSAITDTSKIIDHTRNLPDKLKNAVTTLAHKTTTSMKNLPQGAAHLSGEILSKARWELIELLAKEGEIVKKGQVKEKFEYRKMINEVYETFCTFFSLFGRSFKLPLFWAAVCVMIFSFWDTMAVTYQPLLLKEFAKGDSFLQAISGFLMVLFIFPVFALQIPFAILADKWGRHKLMLIGLAVSGISVLILSSTESVGVLIITGMLSGAGYAAAFSPAQAMFVEEFKKLQKSKGQVEDTEKSAGSLRLSLNMGNVFGQLAGGAMFALLGFRGGFFFFGFFFLVVAIISGIFYTRIRPQAEEVEDGTVNS